MINLADIIEVKIEKLTYGGLGLSRYGEEKFVVFVENALPGDVLKVEITSRTKSYAKARIVEIISSKRTKPLCALYNACGSCDNQLCDYQTGVNYKTEILKDIFPNYNIPPVIKSPKLEEYRRKIQFPCAQTKNSKRILMGYYKNSSHDLINIKFCPMQPCVMNEIASFIKENFPLDCYQEKTHSGSLRHITARFNQNNEALITFILNDSKVDKKLSGFSKKLQETFPNVKGVFANLNPHKTNKILGNTTLKILGEDCLIECLEDKKFKIGAISFFQVNPFATVELFNIVKEKIEPSSTLLDAYGGVGAIGIFVSDKVSKITLVEQNKEATKLAQENFELNSIDNYEILNGDAKTHFKNFKEEKRTFDYVVLDPPRQGADKEALRAIASISNNIIYVSCNPQTLKRDIAILEEFGFTTDTIQGVDMFPYTHHIECVCALKKK